MRMIVNGLVAAVIALGAATVAPGTANAGECHVYGLAVGHSRIEMSLIDALRRSGQGTPIIRKCNSRTWYALTGGRMNASARVMAG